MIHVASDTADGRFLASRRLSQGELAWNDGSRQYPELTPTWLGNSSRGSLPIPETAEPASKVWTVMSSQVHTVLRTAQNMTPGSATRKLPGQDARSTSESSAQRFTVGGGGELQRDGQASVITRRRALCLWICLTASREARAEVKSLRRARP